MLELLNISAKLDATGSHRLADEIDRIVMSEVGYYPPPPPPKQPPPPQEEPPEEPDGVFTGEPPLDDPNKKQNGPVKVIPLNRSKARPVRKMKNIP